MSLLDRQNRLQKFLDDKGMVCGFKFYNVLYTVIDFEELSSEQEEFDTYNVLVKRTHSSPFDMQQLTLATHKHTPSCRSVGQTIETAVSSAKRKFVGRLVSTIRWGLTSARWDKTNFLDYAIDIEKFRIKGQLPDYSDLDNRPIQEVNYVVPAYSGKTLYLSGVLRSNGTYINWNNQEAHDTGIYIGTSFKSLDAAIGDRESKVANYVAARLTAA